MKVPVLHPFKDHEGHYQRLALRGPSSDAWLAAVLGDFSAFLVSHAGCERKAAASAMAFVVKYRDRAELVEAMTDVALEELQHFREVVDLVHARGRVLEGDSKDSYMAELLKMMREQSLERLMDRLLISAVVEARGCERFERVGRALESGPLAQYYLNLSHVEARHQIFFVKLAELYFDATAVRRRLDQILDREFEVLQSLEPRSRLYA